MPSAKKQKRKAKKTELDDEYELDHRILGPTVQVNQFTVVNALRQTVVECISNSNANGAAAAQADEPRIASSGIAITEPSSDARGRTLPAEVYTLIMGHLETAGQNRTLAAFQLCSNSMYKLARPIIYSDMTGPLYGMRKIRLAMHIPTARLTSIHDRVDEKEKLIVENDAWKMVDADETEGYSPIEDLEDGQGKMWFKLSGPSAFESIFD